MYELEFFVFVAFSSFLASDNFCHLLIAFVNSLDPDQDPQTVIMICIQAVVYTFIRFLKEFFEIVNF